MTLRNKECHLPFPCRTRRWGSQKPSLCGLCLIKRWALCCGSRCQPRNSEYIWDWTDLWQEGAATRALQHFGSDVSSSTSCSAGPSKGIPATCRSLVILRDGMLGSSPDQQSWFALHKCQVKIFFVSEINTSIRGPRVLNWLLLLLRRAWRKMDETDEAVGSESKQLSLLKDYGWNGMGLSKRQYLGFSIQKHT